MEKIVKINGNVTDYSVNIKGDVFSNKFGKRIKLKPNTINGGYQILTLSVKGKRHYILVHRIVITAFLENPENKPQTNHINGIK